MFAKWGFSNYCIFIEVWFIDLGKPLPWLYTLNLMFFNPITRMKFEQIRSPVIVVFAWFGLRLLDVCSLGLFFVIYCLLHCC